MAFQCPLSRHNITNSILSLFSLSSLSRRNDPGIALFI